MNVQLKDITVTARDGRVSHLDQVYIRGSHVRFFIVPDMLRYVKRYYQLATSILPAARRATGSSEITVANGIIFQERPHVPLTRRAWAWCRLGPW